MGQSPFTTTLFDTHTSKSTCKDVHLSTRWVSPVQLPRKLCVFSCFCTLWTNDINSRKVETLSACTSGLPCLCNLFFLASGYLSLIIFCFLSPRVSGTNGSHAGRMTQAQNFSVNDLLLCRCWFSTDILSVSPRVTRSWGGVRATDAVRR